MENIPKGILIIKWDNEVGAVLISKYPTKLKIKEKLLTNIHANHQLESTKPNFASITLKDIKITSFFSGSGKKFVGKPNHVVAFILQREENPRKFQEILRRESETILSNLENSKIEKSLPEIFEKLSAIS